MKTLISALAASAFTATSAAALTMTISFAGNTTFNPGLPDDGAFGGTIVYDSDGVVPFGTTGFDGAFESVNMTVSGVGITSAGSPTTDRLTQVQLSQGSDAFLSSYEGSFVPTGLGYEVAGVSLEVRPIAPGGIEIYDDPSDMFSALAGGEVFDLDDFSYISLVVSYVGEPSTSWTILRKNTFDFFDVRVTGVDNPVVPLPAGLPLLLAGMGAFALVKRKSA